MAEHSSVSEEIEVMEEHHKMSDYNFTPSLPLPEQNLQPRYQLQFINKVEDPTYTTDLVRDEIGFPIRVEIYDSYTRSRVSTDCFLSSVEVQLTVVDAEYWKNRVNWSRYEFVQNVLREREGKRPILTGRSLIIQLKNGVGSFENIVLNDNSSWTKSGFRLGDMVKSEREEGYFNEERVQEGVSERFRVKDRRGKASKKPNRLELTHSVRCIKKIGKDRASCLEKININNVENFLKLYYNDEPKLRMILRIKSESSKEWESMIEHVMLCADEYKKKCIASNNSSQPRQNSMIVPHPMEGNLFLSANGGSCVVGLGSSKPNQSYITDHEGDVSAINRPHVPISDFSLINLPNQPISTGRMVQYIGEMHYAGSDGGNYWGIDGGNYGGCGIDNYGGGGIDSGNYGDNGGGIDNGTYGGSGSGIDSGTYCGGGGLIDGATYSFDGNYGGGGGGGGTYSVGGGGNYSSGGNVNCGGNVNYGGGGGNYGGGNGGIDSNMYGGGGNYGGSGGDSSNYSGGGIDIGIYGDGGNYGGGDGHIDGSGGGGNYGGSGNGDGGSRFDRSFIGRKMGMAVADLEGLSLEGSQTGG